MTGDPIVLEVVGIPYPQGNKSAVLRGGKARTIEGKSSGARASLAAWRGAVADAARVWVLTNHALPVAEPCRVSIVFRFAPPAGDRYRTLHATRPDVDKLARSTFDALVHGGLLGDDSYVCSLITEKRYACVGESVGATVEVEPLGWYEAQQREVKKAEAAAARRASVNRPVGMCPHCGEDVRTRDSLTIAHSWPQLTRQVCPGSHQIPRCAESDARPLWNGERNRRFAGAS